MTNGEKLQEIFPTCKIRQLREDIVEITLDGYIAINVVSAWWNDLYESGHQDTDDSGKKLIHEKYNNHLGFGGTGIWTLEYGGTNIYPILGITCSNCHYHTEIHTDADHFDNDIPKVCPQCSSKNIYKK